MQIPDIEMLIPQRAPMLFVESVQRWDASSISAIGRVSEQWPLVRDGFAPGVSAFEFMTQTVAAHQALCAMEAGHIVSGIGVVTGCRQLQVQRPRIEVGTAFAVSAQQIWGDGPSGMYQASVHVSEDTIANARFSVRQLAPAELGLS